MEKSSAMKTTLIILLGLVTLTVTQGQVQSYAAEAPSFPYKDVLGPQPPGFYHHLDACMANVEYTDDCLVQFFSDPGYTCCKTYFKIGKGCYEVFVKVLAASVFEGDTKSMVPVAIQKGHDTWNNCVHEASIKHELGSYGIVEAPSPAPTLEDLVGHDFYDFFTKCKSHLTNECRVHHVLEKPELLSYQCCHTFLKIGKGCFDGFKKLLIIFNSGNSGFINQRTSDVWNHCIQVAQAPTQSS